MAKFTVRLNIPLPFLSLSSELCSFNLADKEQLSNFKNKTALIAILAISTTVLAMGITALGFHLYQLKRKINSNLSTINSLNDQVSKLTYQNQILMTMQAAGILR